MAYPPGTAGAAGSSATGRTACVGAGSATWSSR